MKFLFVTGNSKDSMMTVGLCLGLVFVHICSGLAFCILSVLAWTISFSCFFLLFLCSICFFSVLRQEIGWEERLRNDLFCVEWDVKI